MNRCNSPSNGFLGRQTLSVYLLLIGIAIGADVALAQRSESLLTSEELAEGWVSLFDGETFFGWRPPPKGDWRITEGAIVVTEGDVGLLCTTSQFSDYVLRVEFRCDPSTNSGIFLRTSPDPKDVKRDCYELNIAPPENPFPTGSLVGRKKVEGVGADDQWHNYEVTLDGPRVQVRLDGETILAYDDPQPIGRGYIGLQHNSGRVEFRNVKLKPLRTESLFNGKDLNGWTTYPEMPSKFSVTPEGYLNVKDGRGQLETVGKYDDFVLQLECISNGKHLNSGFFLRCIPGEQMNGYESQIHNGFLNGDRTKPVDAGTGAIFRRTTARRVVPDDFEWFHKTIVADGPHFAVWVNGYQVTDWVDRRKPDPNPRRGRRNEAGTIMIQGHDPTTDLSFRNLRISQIRARR